MEMMPGLTVAKVTQEESYGEPLSVNSSDQGTGNAVCHNWRTLSVINQQKM